ncbi:hypothetical protein [Halorussus pelagicus]|uniref:hypothetical protein n=1 Tax=Halorussus pelagicus TaxID=2505977 RepID=UPI000FFCBC75|nr:hypothetical protein [Halorussus pelagicus]
MSTPLTQRFDVLRAAIGLFVTLGVVLTGVAGYALFAPSNLSVSADVAVSVLSGVSLVAFAAVLTAWLNRSTGRRKRRGSA